MRSTCFILCASHSDTLYIREQGYEDPWLFSAARKGRGPKKKIGKVEPKLLTQLISFSFAGK